MNRFLRHIWCALVVVSFFLATGCEKETTTEPIVPTVEITNVKSTKSSVTFTVVTKDAVKFTYYVSPKGTVGTPTEVSKTTDTQTVSGLEAEKDYAIVVIAQSVDGTNSETKQHDFKTNAEAKVVIGDVTAAARKATVTLTPTNATKYYYVCYPTGAAKPEYIEVEGNESTNATLTDLTPETDYTIEAYATNAEGDSAPVTKTFKTAVMPKALTITSVSTEQTIAIHFELDKPQAAAFYYSDIMDPDAEDDPDYPVIRTLAEFVDYIKSGKNDSESETGLELFSKTTDESLWTLFNYQDGGVVFGVCVDKDGNLMEDTAVEITVKLAEQDRLETGTANAVINSVSPKATDVSANLSFPDNAALYTVLVAEKSMVTPSLIVYATSHMHDQPLNLIKSKTLDINRSSLKPQGSYVMIVLTVDTQGKFGTPISKDFSTGEVEIDETITLSVNVKRDQISSMVLGVETNLNVVWNPDTNPNPDVIRMEMLSDEDYKSRYNSDPEAVMAELYTPDGRTMQVENGEYTESGVAYNSQYHLFALPVRTSDGAFGKPVVDFKFRTYKYTQAGNASVTINAKGGKLVERSETNKLWYVLYDITPNADCVKYAYMPISVSEWDSQHLTEATLGEYMFKMFASCEIVEGYLDRETYCQEDLYIVAIGCDKDGNWGVPVRSDRMIWKDPYAK